MEEAMKNFCQFSSSAKLAADGLQLSEDVMIEILVRLPVKSLVRFRCVSKSLSALIKSPIFINTHLCLKQRKNVLLLRRTLQSLPHNNDLLSFHDPDSPELDEVSPNLPIPFLEDFKFKNGASYYYEDVFLLGSCNGLVCVFHHELIILCNPALREFKLLPPCPFVNPNPPPCNLYGLHLDFLARGFGNTCTNNFKIFLIENVDPENTYSKEPLVMVYLYSTSTNSWRQIDVDSKQLWCCWKFSCFEISLHGTCYSDVISMDSYEAFILTFELSNEVLGQLVYLEFGNIMPGLKRLTVINEILALVFLEHPSGPNQIIDVWVMKQYGVEKSWTKQFVIRSPLHAFYPFMCLKNDEWLLVETKYGILASFAFYTYEIRTHQIYPSDSTFRALIYKESLISVDQLIN